METIMLTFPYKEQTEAENEVRRYRFYWRVWVALGCVLAFIIGMLLGHIKHLTDDVVIVTYTETIAPFAGVEPAAVVAEPVAIEPPAFFDLTTAQRTLIEQVVSAESRGETYKGQVAVAQCILNACLIDEITPERAIEKYKYTTNRAEPTDSVKEAVAAVFDRGEGVTEEPILYFYAPALVTSEFHESQDFVIEIGCHRFFKAAD